MSSIFSGLESLGLGNLANMNIIDKSEEKEQKTVMQEVKQIKESDFIFDKSYTCPVCDQDFKSKTVKVGKVRLISADTDLRPKYQNIDPLKYDVVACPSCGYAALTRYFPHITSAQIRLIKTNISATFKGVSCSDDFWSYDESLTKYKLALVNSIVKKSKISERAYTCLKSAWVIRGKLENLPEDTENRDSIILDLENEELEFISNAYEGFMEAFSRELFPMCGMDENTITYLVSDLARKIGKREEALRWLSKVITSRGSNERIKNKARELKDIILEK